MLSQSDMQNTNMKYTEEEILQLEALCRELLIANEELNARVIAMNAKLENEEKKVKRLMNMINWITNDKGNHA